MLTEGRYIRRTFYGAHGSFKKILEEGTTGYHIERTAREIEKGKDKETSKDTELRISIQKRIMELEKLGFPKEEAIIRLTNEFFDSGYEGFFEGWIENVYNKAKKNKERAKNGLNRFKEEER